MHATKLVKLVQFKLSEKTARKVFDEIPQRPSFEHKSGVAMALANAAALKFSTSAFLGFSVKPFVMRARGNARTDCGKTRNRRMQKKYNGTSKGPRLSVFCSDKQLYATLADDQNKNYLFYGNTLQKYVRLSPDCSSSEAAKRLGEELVKACNELNIHEISSYDRSGFATGERIQAFEIAISQHGFLSR